jgi:ABC-type transporter Mla MlaB component
MLTCGFNQGQVILEGELQVAFLGPLADCLEQALPFEQPVEVHLGQVSGVDVAGLQLLMAFLQSRRQVGPVGLRECSPVFLKALELAGLSEHFAAYLDQ